MAAAIFLDNMGSYIPDIEPDLPLPASAAEALPDLTPDQELAMRARTIKFLSDLNGVALEPTEDDKTVAVDLAKKMMTDPKFRPAYSKYPNETLAYLAGMVAQSNCMIVEELSDLKLYIVNKLVYEVEHAENSKARISALTALGNVDGVDAFKRRSEITHTVKPIEEVEKELKDILDNVEYHVVRQEQLSITDQSDVEDAEIILNG